MTASAINRLLCAADEEAQRLGQGYVGPEHLLLALLRDEEGPACRALATCGARLVYARAAVTRLIAAGLLPDAASDADLLAGFGIDLKAVQRRADATFGADAVDHALRRSSPRPHRRGTPTRNPLCGRPVLVKRALELAAREAAALEDEVCAGHVLLGVIADAYDKFGSDLGRRGRAVLRELGFSDRSPHPLGLLLDELAISPRALHDATLAELLREAV